jgi:hypothetical protein
MTAFLAIRVVHVVLGAFWVGAVLFAALFLDPVVRELGPVGGRVMGILQRRGYVKTMLAVGVTTVLTGVYLLWRISGGFSADYMGMRAGILLSSGGLAAILALVVGSTVTRPTAAKLGAIASRVAGTGAPPSADDAAQIAVLQRRMTVALRTVAVLLLVALAAMALGPHS